MLLDTFYLLMRLEYSGIYIKSDITYCAIPSFDHKHVPMEELIR